MPPLPPGVSKVGLVKGYGGWNNSSLSRRSNTISGLLSTRTPQSTGNSGGGIANPSLGIGVISEAMPKGATGSWVPRPISLRRPNFRLQKTFEGENDFDQFGNSVAISGDYAIVGAISFNGGGNARGKVYIYERNAQGTWGEVQTFVGQNDGDGFGHSVAISDNYAIVGANRFQGGGINRGKVYIYERGAGGWPITPTETFEGENDGDFFGNSVAISADYAIVGAVSFDGGGINRGKVYIYERGAGGWPVTATATFEGENNNDFFGNSVAISADYAIVGANGSQGGGINRGKVYIYERGAGGWPTTPTETFEGENNNDLFGNSVSISGGYAIVGAYGSQGGGIDRGKVYIYERGAGGWPTIPTTTFEGENNNDLFGNSVSISGGYAIVGAYGFRGGGITRGKVHIYERGAGVWTEATTFEGENDFNQFGYSVAISGDYAIVGAESFDGGGINRGKVYIYER
jgi:hypothetical protein